MNEAGIAFKKHFGQNFLVNPVVLEKIAENASENVLEIGPGIGTLTRALSEKAAKVIAVEIDSDLIPVLKKTLDGYTNVTVINADAMKTDFAALVKEHFTSGKMSVCANLPYYVTTPVIMALLESEIPFENITVMIQKEVAARLCASPGDPDFGAITAAVSYYGKAEKLFTVTAGNFIPSPKVDSAVLKITLYKEPPVSVGSKKMLMRVIKGAFAQRRKTLLNSLSSEFSSLSKEAVESAVISAGCQPTIRGEKLQLSEFAAIADRLDEMMNKL